MEGTDRVVIKFPMQRRVGCRPPEDAGTSATTASSSTTSSRASSSARQSPAAVITHRTSPLNTSSVSSPNITQRTARMRQLGNAKSIETPRAKITPTIRKTGSATRSAERDKIRELESRLRRKDDVSKSTEMRRIEQQLDEIVKAKKNEDQRAVRAEHSLHSTREELAATLQELDEARAQISSLELSISLGEKKRKILEKDLSESRRTVDDLRVELSHVRRRSCERRILSVDHSENVVPDPADPTIKAEEDEVEKARRDAQTLRKEIEQMQSEREIEREEHRSMLRDMLVAVRVAESLKQAAEEELGRFRSRLSSSSNSPWSGLMIGRPGETKRNSLLHWAQTKLLPYPSISVHNFSSDWADGRALCALIHAHRPNLLNRTQLQNNCIELATSLGERLSVDGLDSELLGANPPDWKKMMSVVLELYNTLSHPSSCRKSEGDEKDPFV